MSDGLQGTTVGKYRILEPLGRGGMARVYRAYHPQLDRYVAIKVLRPELAEEAEFLGRFQREARAIAALRHPHIVQVHDFDVQGDLYYMVMELLEGDTLKSYLSDCRLRGTWVTWDVTVRILFDLLDGLGYAHHAGIIHRDLKPANILLTRSGQVVISDFGIAQMLGTTRQTASGALLGTLAYMAPEQGLEGHSDARSDLYSLGVLFYEMLTQRLPFDADTPLAVLLKHLNDPLVPPRQLNSEIPESLEQVVLGALTKDPDARYQSAAEMALALHAAAESASIIPPARVPLLSGPRDVFVDAAVVFSGAERDKLGNVAFATEDTDVGLRQGADRDFQGDVAKAILGAVGLVLTVNLILFTLATLTGKWALFTVGWPVELFLLSIGFSSIMAMVRSIWLLIPTSLLMGNGLALGLCTLTTNWRHWSFLWLFEVWLIFVTVAVTVLLARQEEQAARTSRRLGWVMGMGGCLLVSLMLWLVLVA